MDTTTTLNPIDSSLPDKPLHTTTTTTTTNIAPGTTNPIPNTTSRELVRDDRLPTTTNHSLPWSDDADGHLVFKLGDGLYPTSEHPQGRYKILSSLGEGTFGKVVECWDRCLRRRVAVKIVRSISKYREAALLEIDVLVHLSFHDPDGRFHCVKLYSWFEHLSHVCMVFEKLGPSLYEHLRKKRFRPFSIDEVRAYAFQLLESVSFVHSLTLIHTDLKPENILLVDHENPQSIKLIDFGSATFQHQHHSAVVSTRHYRAPEVILGLGWTYPCDLWSVGCILVELYTGQALFQTHENLEHLAMMSVVLGPIPQRMILRANDNCREYFRTRRGGDGGAVLNWPGGASSKASLRSVKKVRSLADMVRPDDGGAHFLDLLKRLLAFEPETRCTSEEALSHPFFMQAHGPTNAGESDYLPTSMTHSSGSSAPLPSQTANIDPKIPPAAEPIGKSVISRPRKRMRGRTGGAASASATGIEPLSEHASGEQQREENSGTVSRSKSRSKTAGGTSVVSGRRRGSRRQSERQHYLES